MSRTVTVSGEHFELDRASVARVLAGVLPEPLHDHYVVIGGRRYPPKQVIAIVTGLDRADFTTHQARRILRRLGFPADRRSRAGDADPRPTGNRSTTERGEALRPYIGSWVATRGDEVLVAAKTAAEVVSWLTEHDQQAESMFRVPESEAAAGGAAPL